MTPNLDKEERVVKKGLITLLILMMAMTIASSTRTSLATHVGLESTAGNAQTGQEIREEFRQTYPLSATGRVSVENLNGAVRINVSDQNEVQVYAVKRAYRPERLAEARIDIRATTDSIRIKTEYPSRSQSFTSDERGRINNPAVVDYTLTVPRQARLESIELVNGELRIEGAEGDVRASSINGPVRVQGLKGEAKLSTINGPLEASFIQLDETKSISLNSVNGSVLLVIPSNANAVVRASTVHGGITNDFGLKVQHGNYVGHELYGQLGSGGPQVRLGNVNGSITIKHAGDGGKLSSVSDLITEREKDQVVRAEAARQRTQLRETNRQVRQAQIEAARAVKQEQTIARREVERALREAQREIERAQLEVRREVAKRMREEMRSRSRNGGAASTGAKTEGRAFVEEETRTFKVTDKPRVTIGTFDGTVKVNGWDKPEVMYKAVKYGHSPDELKQIHINTDQRPNNISIVARAPAHQGTTNLEVYVPRNASVHATSADGSLSIKGVSGEVTLRTGDGPIEVTDGSGRLIANTGDGQIRIANFEGQIEARTGDGPISLDGRFSGVVARTGGGNIALAIPADSDFTIETNVDSVTNEGLTLSEEFAPSKRVKRWKVGRGGNVFTLNTGEGQLILRPRKQ